MPKIIFLADLVWDGQVARGGHAMVVLQWLHGLKRLGHDVLLLDYVGLQQLRRRSATLSAFTTLIAEWWHPAQACLIHENNSLLGLSISAVQKFARDAAAVIQFGIPGRRQPPALVEKIRPRILLEQDPAYTHLWATGYDPAEMFGEQDFYFTVGGNVGSPRCSLPTFGLQWKPIWNPVIMSWWTGKTLVRDRFTTIADWYSQGYLEFDGKVLGPKSVEFRKFINLPQLVGEHLEIALAISSDDPDSADLRKYGWQLESPDVVRTPELYRDYVTGSVGEFSCTKGGYAGTNCGWFSDRSACYLAAGRPVVLQDTGFADLLPTGKGLFSVRTAEEAAEAIRAIRKDYRQHSAAARAIALEHFDSDKILTHMVTAAGIPVAKT
jgi:hypothetical protein